MIGQRSLIGIAAIVCTLAGIASLLLNQENTSSISGILIRVGLMLGATWLAMPSLVKPEHQNSLYMIAMLFAAIVLVAARPRLFVAAVLIGGVALILNWGLKRISRGTKK